MKRPFQIRTSFRTAAIGTCMLVGLLVGTPPCPAGDETRETIVFVSCQTDSGWYDVWSMNPDGSKKTNLTRNEAIEIDPTWSPDRQRIAFVELLPEKRSAALVVMSAEGAERRQIVAPKEGRNILAPSWSPDGKRLLFTTFEMNTQGMVRTFALHTIDVQGEEPAQLLKDQALLGAFSPDGSQILYAESKALNPLAKQRLCLMDSDGQNTRTLVEELSGMGAWSPDGRRIVCYRETNDERGICVLNADGSDLKLIRRPTGNDAECGPQWSPDGNRIFFTGVRLGAPPTASIFAMNADGSNVKRLTPADELNFLGDRSGVYIPVQRMTTRQPAQVRSSKTAP